MLVFLIVLVALVVYGSRPAARKMGMDELWVRLYTGQVAEISVNDVGSAFTAKMADGTTFKVPVTDARLVWETVREMQAKSQRDESGDLLRGLQDHGRER